MADAEGGSPFWRFSLATYRKPGVADACLALQDGCGVDVNVLLFVTWLGTQGRRLDADATRAVADRADSRPASTIQTRSESPASRSARSASPGAWPS